VRRDDGVGREVVVALDDLRAIALGYDGALPRRFGHGYLLYCFAVQRELHAVAAGDDLAL
jgi:hypothetical protein